MTIGYLASTYAKKRLHTQVLRSNAGYYIGTADEEGPCSRESAEYWSSHHEAQLAMEKELWTQRETP